MRRPGFTLIELVSAMAIIGAVTAMAIPKLDDLERRTTASEILQDVDIVKNGTYRFYSDSGYFPRETASGTIPDNLSQYLPPRFSFSRKGRTIDFQNWNSRTPSIYVKTGIQIGVSITMTDPKLGATVMDMYGNNPKFMVGSRYTFLIVGL
jgi:prepilin-type N-terminal cleavage/methylation domain-containing protein